MTPRFKIDFSGSPYPFGLYFKRQSGVPFIWWWEMVDLFETHAEARAYYNKIKFLPEYLD